MGVDFKAIREERKKNINAMLPTTYHVNLLDLIITISVKKNAVFDLETKAFSLDIINSANTDIQVLIASMDLITLLINGNQLVITSKKNFQQC